MACPTAPVSRETCSNGKNNNTLEIWEITEIKEEAGDFPGALLTESIFGWRCWISKNGWHTRLAHVSGYYKNNTLPHVNDDAARLIADVFHHYNWEWIMQSNNKLLTRSWDAKMFQALAKMCQCQILETWKMTTGSSSERRYVTPRLPSQLMIARASSSLYVVKKGLNVGVQKVCRSYYAKDAVGKEGLLGLSQLAPCDLMAAKGEVVEKFEEDIDEEAASLLK